MHILMVDDDEDIREVVSLILQEEGHDVAQAEDGFDALKQLHHGDHPSVILLDLMMPRLDGEGFMRALRSDPHTADIPVIIMSGHRIARQTAAELGASACLVKPIDLDQLLDAIDRAAGPIT